MASMRRRQQRDVYRQANFIRIKNRLMRKSEMAIEWYNARRQEGIEKMRQFENQVIDSLESQRMTRLNSAKSKWQEEGYNDAEIKLLEESWILTSDRDQETWHSDKKRARALAKEAFISRKSRI